MFVIDIITTRGRVVADVTHSRATGAPASSLWLVKSRAPTTPTPYNLYIYVFHRRNLENNTSHILSLVCKGLCRSLFIRNVASLWFRKPKVKGTLTGSLCCPSVRLSRAIISNKYISKYFISFHFFLFSKYLITHKNIKHI